MPSFVFKPRRMQVASFLFLLLCGLVPVGALGANTIAAGTTSGAPGSSVNIPITLSLGTGVTADTLAFKVTVAANGSAPVLTSGTLTFTQAGSLPAPAMNVTNGANAVAVAWLSQISPALSGTVVVGSVAMTIPASAQNGDGYTVQVSNTSATVGTDMTEVAVSGVNGAVTVTVLPPDSLAAAAGAPTSGTVGAKVNLTVTATRSGTPVAGWPITFAVTAGGGSVSPLTANTDASGQATTALTIGTAPGANTVTGTANNTTLSAVTFTVTGQAGAASSIASVSGGSQSGTVGTALASNFTVKVADSYGNGISGVTVTFAVTAGGGSLSASSVATDASGQASSKLTLGTTAGSNNNTATASATGLTGSPVTFTASANAGPATKVVVQSGSGQSGMVGAALGSPLVAQVTDAYGNPISGITVTFSLTSGSATLGAAPGATGADGLAQITVTLGTAAGPIVVTASATGLTSATFNLTANAGVASAIAADTGGGQAGTVGTALANSFVVKVTDTNGNPVSGVAVAFAVTGGGGTLSASSVNTDASGKAASKLTLGTVVGTNNNTVTATVAGLSGSPVTFTASANAGAGALLAIVGGDAQSGAVGAALGTALAVKVTDSYGNPVSGVAVTFAATTGQATLSGGGAATTGADGKAQVTATLGTTAGAVKVTASATGLTSVIFNLTANPGPAAAISALSGSGQTGTVGVALGNSFTVKVADSYGNGISGVTVTFAVTAGGGSLSASSVATDASGQAASKLTLGTTAGSSNNSATASAAGLAGSPVTFTASANAGPATAIAADSGGGQTGTVGTALTNSFVVKVTDTYGNPVSGAAVAFAVTGGGGTLSAASVNTDASGQAASKLTLGTAAGTNNNTVTASAAGLSGSPVTFTASANAGPAAVVAVVSGSGQSGTVAALGSPLVAKVTDSYGNPKAGVTVTFAVTSGSATLGAAPGATVADGLAQITITLGTAAGPIVVTASATGLTSATFNLTANPGPAVTITAVSGSGQTGVAGSALGGSFVVKVADTYANGVSGVTVAFAVTAGGGSLSASSVATDASGQASSKLTLGTVVGTSNNTVTATAAGLTGSPVTFTASVAAGPPSTLNVVSGSGQSGTVGTGLAGPLVVKVADAYGNPYSGVNVAFAVTAGSATLSASSVATGADGQAQVTVTLATTAGAVTVTASATGLPSATFSATANAGAAASISAVSGSGQTGTVGTALANSFVVKVTDSYGNAVSGVSVAFAVTAGGGTPSAAAASTDASGQASSKLTLGTVTGSNNNSVTASATGLSGSPVTFTASATAGAAGAISAVSGDGQTGTVGAALSSSFVVKVVDSYGNAVSGVTVTFAVTAGGGTLSAGSAATDATGQASSKLTLGHTAGTNNNTATASASGLTGSPVTFSASATPGVAASVAAASGSGQSGTVAANLANPLVAKVTDSYGNGVSGVTVNFTLASGSATLSAASATTGSDGQAQVTVTLGNTAGAVSVTAAVTGLTPATFSITANPGPAASITAVSGDGQTGTVGAALAASFVVKVTDTYGNAVSGVAVAFAATAGGGSMSPATVNTDSSGLASSKLTLGPTAGSNNNTAAASATGLTGSPVTFNATSVAGPPASIAIVSGNNQSAIVKTALTNALVVLVSDAYANPISGANVAFTVTAGTATLSAASAATGANGQAQITVTLGTTAGAVSIRASVGAVTPAVFNATAQPGPAAALNVVSGNNQSAYPGNTLGAPLVLSVTDQYGNGVSGVVVTFSQITGGGSLGVATATTGASGQVQVTWTLGGTAGPNTVTASAGTLTPVVCTASAFKKPEPPPSPGTIIAVSGGGQSGPINSTLPGPLIVQVNNSDGTAAQAVAVGFAVTSGSATLSNAGTITNASGTAQTMVTLGSTPGTVTVTASGGGAAGSAVFTLTATSTATGVDTPQLGVAPASLSFTVFEGAAAPSPQSVFVVNIGTGTMTFTAAASGGAWLSAAASGQAPASFPCSINPAGLKAGSYQGAVTVQAPPASATGSPQTARVTVTLTVLPSERALAVAPASLVFQADSGSTAVLSASVAVTNTASGQLAWTVGADSASSAWLSASGGGNTPGTAAIQVRPSGLTAGQYTGAVTFSSPDVPSRSVNVLLTVYEAAELRVSPGLLRFSGSVGSSFSAQALQVTTASGQSIPFSVTTELPQGRTWLVAVGSGTTPGSVSASANAAGLAAGTYTSSLIIRSDKARGSVAVPVVLDLLPAGAQSALTASPGGVLLIAETGATASQDVAVKIVPAATVAWGASSSTSDGGTWLSAAGGGSGDGTLTIRANASGLALGVYTGVVALSAPETTNKNLSVGVTLLVIPGRVASASLREIVPAAAATVILVPAEPARQFAATVGIPVRVEAWLVDSSGKLISGADVRVSVSGEQNPVVLKDAGQGLYAALWTPMQSGVTVLTFASGTAASVMLPGSVSAAAKPLPILANGGAVNGASFAAGLPLAPGSIVSLFGMNLAAAAASASAVPLPKSLGNASVSVNGVAAPLFYVGPGQVNLQIPQELSGQALATIRFASPDGVSILQNVVLSPLSPGIFLAGATQQGAIIHQDGRLAGVNAPAAAGETLSIYATGLGDVTNIPPTGAPASATPLSETRTKPVVTIGGVTADVSFSGLAPGFVGLYQVNVKVPSGVSGNAVPVIVKVGAATSNTAQIAVQ
jgi:adhesin/invasin